MKAAKQETSREKAWEAHLRKSRIRRLFFCAIALLLLALAVSLLIYSGIFEKKSENDLMTLRADGSLVVEERMPASVASVSEVRAFVRQEIDDYNESAGAADGGFFLGRKQPVSLERLVKDKDSIYLRVRYESASVYQAFSGSALYRSTVLEAAEQGYDFTDVYAAVAGTAKTGLASREDLLHHPRYTLVRVQSDIPVKVPGTVRFVSDTDTELLAPDTVRILSGEDNAGEANIAYIIYEPEISK